MTAMRGQQVTLTKGYSARGFALRPGEEPAAEFAAFDRTDRAPRLIAVRPGDQHAALTEPAADGGVYVRIDQGDASYACILLPGTFTT